MTSAAKFYKMKLYIFNLSILLPYINKENFQRVRTIMLTTIATIYASLSITASILILAAVRLSSQISQQEQLVEATIIITESQPNNAAPYSLKD